MGPNTVRLIIGVMSPPTGLDCRENMQQHLYLIVSDLHTTDVEDHDDGWKRHKSSKFVFDAEFDQLVRWFTKRANDENELTLILNGDIFDFDLVTAVPDNPSFPVSRSERKAGLRPTPAKSVWKLRRMIEHHPKLMGALARFLAAGHKVVYVIGNHDQELQFQPVREVFHEAIGKSADHQGLALDDDARIQFEPWFYYVPNEIYAEHGQQYDAYSSFRHVLAPVVETRDGTGEIALPMGNLSCRELINRLGFFNPHEADGFILSFLAYLAHWVRHYAFTRRSLIGAWFWGSLLVLKGTLKNRARVLAQGPDTHEEKRRELAERVSLPLEVLEKIDQTRIMPIVDRLFRVVRELWLDRLLLAFVLIGATIALALTPIPLWIKLMVPLSSFPLVFLVYETVVAESCWEYMTMFPAKARAIAEAVGCPVVAFGHTHIPMTLPLARGVTFVNTGTWSPTWDAAEALTPGTQNYAVVEVDNGAVEVEIGSWLEANVN